MPFWRKSQTSSSITTSNKTYKPKGLFSRVVKTFRLNKKHRGIQGDINQVNRGINPSNIHGDINQFYRGINPSDIQREIYQVNNYINTYYVIDNYIEKKKKLWKR